MFRVKGAAGFAGLGGHLSPCTPDPCLLPGMAHLLLIFGSLCLGPQLKKSPSCCIWKFAACQRAFPCSFRRYTGVAASNLQKMPSPSRCSATILLSPSHLLFQEGISKASHGISLPLHETTVAVCAVILCRALL